MNQADRGLNLSIKRTRVLLAAIVRLLPRRLWIAGLLLGCGQATAQPALLSVDGSVQQLGIPAERLKPFCVPNVRSKELERIVEAIAGAARAGQTSGSRVLAVLFQCSDLPSLRRGDASGIREWMLVYERETSPGRPVELPAHISRADVVSFLRESYPGPKPADKAAELTAMNKALSSMGASVDGFAEVGLLGSDANAVYFGALGRGRTPQGVQNTAVVSAATLYRRRLTIFALYERYEGVPDFSRLLDAHKAHMDRLLD